MKRALRWVLVLVLVGCVAAWLVLREVERRMNADLVNYHRIEDGLYLGGNVEEPPPGTEAVLNLCEFEDPYRSAVHAWQPIRDAAPAPDLAWLRKQVEFIDAQRREGRVTYVHCFNGVSRGGMVVTAYVMFKNRCGRDEALARVRQQRPIVRPNPAFLERLLEWEQELKGAK